MFITLRPQPIKPCEVEIGQPCGELARIEVNGFPICAHHFEQYERAGLVECVGMIADAHVATETDRLRYQLARANDVIAAADVVMEGIRKEAGDFIQPGPRMFAYDAAREAYRKESVW